MRADVVCVIPALDAAATVGTVVESMRQAVPGVFVLSVDDGSTDNTRTILRKVSDHIIEFDTNHGKGAALRAAFTWVSSSMPSARAVMTIDADGQHDASCAPRLLDKLSEADIVIGARHIFAMHVPPLRRFANRLSTAAVRVVTKWPVHDSQSGFRAMRIDVVRTVHARGDRYEFETDFLACAARAGYTYAEVEVPTIYGPPSHFRALVDAWRVTRVLLNHGGAVFGSPRGAK